MKFNGKKQFKKAMTRYVLAEKKVVNFMKDDHKRVRVTCDWDSYPWGILNAIEKCAPEAEHRNCARHIYANWKRHFPDKQYQKKFWRCAKAPCRMLFNLARAKLVQVTQAGAQAILNTHPQHWSRAWFRTNNLDDYIATSYSVESFKATYAHCLEPVEGMSAWPEDDREPLTAHGYIRMLGKPKIERRREMHEPAKPTKMSRFGTRLRCSKCKLVGHNKSRCGKQNSGTGPSTGGSKPPTTQNQPPSI
ncbi:hypothetical protein OsI_24821 [Oryza sativa Indica Group]|uniref:Uncharacterized protein n=2 Tax=Oryza sativa TaxID=4530 RepID=B9FVE6_ORYSJ|nr:hypothetical protein OsI_24821 [Oryza sativa Indica Group]EEE66533.1 hypothetical protein OsJ_23020 [Oryza sativa Japonica Group]